METIFIDLSPLLSSRPPKTLLMLPKVQITNGEGVGRNEWDDMLVISEQYPSLPEMPCYINITRAEWYSRLLFFNIVAKILCGGFGILCCRIFFCSKCPSSLDFHRYTPISWIIKTQRQILELNLKIRKAKQTSHKRALTSKKFSIWKRMSSCLIPVYIPV